MSDGTDVEAAVRFIGGCFQQEGRNWADALKMFVVDQSPADLRALAQDIDDLRQDRSEAELATLIKGRAQCAYDPRPTTYHDWLRELSGRLRWHARRIEVNRVASRDLQQFFGGYFHQDWDLEADDWEGVVDNYVDDIPDVGRLRALAGEIAALCEKYAEPELEQLMNRTILLDFRPWPLTHHEWLGEVAARLHRHADGIAAARRTVTQDRRP